MSPSSAAPSQLKPGRVPQGCTLIPHARASASAWRRCASAVRPRRARARLRGSGRSHRVPPDRPAPPRNGRARRREARAVSASGSRKHREAGRKAAPMGWRKTCRNVLCRSRVKTPLSRPQDKGPGQHPGPIVWSGGHCAARRTRQADFWSRRRTARPINPATPAIRSGKLPGSGTAATSANTAMQPLGHTDPGFAGPPPNGT